MNYINFIIITIILFFILDNKNNYILFEYLDTDITQKNIESKDILNLNDILNNNVQVPTVQVPTVQVINTQDKNNQDQNMEDPIYIKCGNNKKCPNGY